MTVARLVADLELPLSSVRLENYRSDTGSDLDMVVNYFFNVELSEALYPSLQAFEIALRNSIHQAFTQHFDTEFWFDGPHLYPAPPSPETLPWQQQAIQDARNKLTGEKKPQDADRIIAELHLGYWNSLFNRPFVDKLWIPNHGALLAQVFPHATRRQQVARHLEKRITRIRILRNRVMHFEPVWKRRHLRQNHEEILEALFWISPVMSDAIAMCDRFPEVIAVGRESVKQRVETEIARRYSPP